MNRATIDDAYKVYSPDVVLNRLAASHFVVPSRPSCSDEEPQIPDNMDLMTPQDLRELHAKFSAWLSYVNGLLVVSVATVGALKELRAFVEASLHTDAGGSTKAKTERVRDRQVLVLQDPRYVEINARYMEEESMLAALKTRVARLENDLQAISRQITIAIGERPSRGFGT